MSDQTCTQANMLTVFPLTTARDRCWWSHCASCGYQTCQQVSLRGHSKKEWWTCHTHQWFQLQLVERGNCFEGRGIFGILQPLSLCSCRTCLSGSVFVVAPSKSVHDCCIPY